jgi:HlyD family secretion protein
MDRKLLETELVSQLAFERSKGNAERMAILADAEQQRVESVRESVAASEMALDARLRRLENTLARHQARKEESFVRAGLGGIVRELALEPGQWVEEGQLLARIASRGEMRAEVRIREAEASVVREGQSARLEILGSEVAGRVEGIDPASENGTVRIEISILDALPSGAALDLTLEGSVLIESIEDELAIPIPTVYRSEAPLSIFRLDPQNGTARRTQVILGRRSRQWVEVLSGLREGDRVVLSDHPELASSDLIRLGS